MIFGGRIGIPEEPSKLDGYKKLAADLEKLHQIDKSRTPEGRLVLAAFDLAITAAPLAADDRFYGIARKTIIEARRLIECAVDGGYLDAPEIEDGGEA